MWFTELALVEDPGRRELQSLVLSIAGFLAFVLELGEDFGFLWEHDRSLQRLALETFNEDVQRSAEDLLVAIPKIPEQRLNAHGLLGRPMSFKLRVMDVLGKQWERVRGQSTIREWFRRMIEAIDAALDSLISAAGGVGGLIKEFKDALYALAGSET